MMILTWWVMEAILVGAPVLAMIAFVLLRRKWPAVQLKVMICCAASLLIVICCVWLRLSFIKPLGNFICVGLAYLAYCYLVFSCWRLPKILRLIAVIILSVPIVVGYIGGTIGSLGLMFIVGESYEQPLQIVKYDAGLICRIVPWGAAMSDEGYTVHLYQHWAAISFLEREVQEIVIDQSDPEGGPTSASCNDALASYNHK
jgi:hypothetical protein